MFLNPALQSSKPIMISRCTFHTRVVNISAGDPDLYNGYWGYVYTKASVAGEATFDSTVLGEAMLPRGEYELRLMLDGIYVILATTSFTVTE